MEEIVAPLFSIHPSFDQGLLILSSTVSNNDQLQAILDIHWESLDTSKQEEITNLFVGIIKVMELYQPFEYEQIHELIAGTLSTISFIITHS